MPHQEQLSLALVVLAIGFLVGVVLKKTVKLGLAVLSLVVLLVGNRLHQSPAE